MNDKPNGNSFGNIIGQLNMDTKNRVAEVVRLGIEKGVDVEFSECPDFHDARTFNIFLEKDEKWIYESERVDFSCVYINEILDKVIDFLSRYER